MKTKKNARKSAYEIVTERMLKLIDEGGARWKRCWASGSGWPRSLASGKRYRGINVILTGCAGFESPYWLTFRQAQARGGSVRKGEKGTPVVFWHLPEAARDEGIVDEGTGDEAAGWKTAAWLRYYTVFNAAQCEGIDAPEAEDVVRPRTSAARLEAAERLVGGYEGGPEIRSGFAQPAYRPSEDVVRMPTPTSFTDDEHFYSVLFHELAHSTGAAQRLARQTICDPATNGTGARN